MTHYPLHEVERQAAPTTSGCSRVALIDLLPGDSMDVFASSKGKKIYGPKTVMVRFWNDGGIDQAVLDRDIDTTEDEGDT